MLQVWIAFYLIMERRFVELIKMKKYIIPILMVCLAIVFSAIFVYAGGIGDLEKEKPVVTYTPTTDKTCLNGKCDLTLYSGIRNVYEDEVWKRPEEARSLKGSGIECVIDSDGEHIAKCLDWNMTSIKLDLSLKSVSLTNKEVPIKIYKHNESNYSQLILKLEITESFSSLSNAKEKEVLNFEYGDIIHFGDKSTFISLMDNETENLGDAYLSMGNNKNTNYGIYNYLYVGNRGTSYGDVHSVLMFNISMIPSGSIIDNANISLRHTSETLENGEVLELYEYNNWTWNETNITGANFCFECVNTTLIDTNSTIDSLGGTDVWITMNTTTIIQNNLNKEKLNASFFYNLSLHTTSDTILFYSANYNTALKPHINITYSEGASDTCTCPGDGENWEIDLSDYCVISEACNIGNGNITFTGEGNATFSTTITACLMDRPPANQILYLDSDVILNLGGSC